MKCVTGGAGWSCESDQGQQDVVGDRNGVRHGHEQGRTSVDRTRRNDVKTGVQVDGWVVKKRVGVSVGSRSGQFEAQGPDLKNSLGTFSEPRACMKDPRACVKQAKGLRVRR